LAENKKLRTKTVVVRGSGHRHLNWQT